MIVKETTADGYTLYAGVARHSVVRGTTSDACTLTFQDGTEHTFPVRGTVYVMNDAGATVDRFSPRQQKQE